MISAQPALQSRSTRAVVAFGLVCWCACQGCSQTEPPLPAVPTSTPAVSSASPGPTPAGDVAAADQGATSPTEKDATADEKEEYQPPFPDRVELFVAPKRQGKAVKQDGEFEEAVELLGFVKVDRPRAILSIAGQVTPLAEGTAKYGIEVVTISPPKVVLRRGRQRWEASLDN